MKRFITALFASLLPVLAACGGDDSSRDPEVYGSWVYDGNSSGVGLTLNRDGTYVYVEGVVTSSTSAQMQFELGRFSQYGSDLVFYNEQSSCAGDKKTSASYHFVLSENSLSLVLPSGLLVMKRNTARGTDNALLATGCFRNGYFYPGPIVQL